MYSFAHKKKMQSKDFASRILERDGEAKAKQNLFSPVPSTLLAATSKSVFACSFFLQINKKWDSSSSGCSFKASACHQAATSLLPHFWLLAALFIIIRPCSRAQLSSHPSKAVLASQLCSLLPLSLPVSVRWAAISLDLNFNFVELVYIKSRVKHME